MVTMGLSEKAKGKQRAVEPESDALAPGAGVGATLSQAPLSPAPPHTSIRIGYGSTIGSEAEARVQARERERRRMLLSRELTVRFADGLPDLRVEVDLCGGDESGGEGRGGDTIRSVKRKIRASRLQLARRRLRLIHSGRILGDTLVLRDWLTTLEKRAFNQLEGDVNYAPAVSVTTVAANGHATSASAKGKGKARADRVVDGDGDGESDAETSAAMRPYPVWLHCSVGAEMTGDEEEEEEEEERVQSSQIKPLRGFDRLAAAGFTEEDIANFRRTFHSQSMGNYLDVEPLGDDEDYDEHARALEEQWIDSLDGGNQPTLSHSSASTTVLQGLIAGFFFSLLPFFFLKDPRPAVFWENGSSQEASDSGHSRKMQMALVLGFIINLTFGLWRYLLGT